MEEHKEEYPKAYLYRRIVQAKIFIDNHFSERIYVDDIAGKAYFSKFHFIRLFKSCFGQTPHHYLRDKRLQKTKELLAQTELSVEQICMQVGFESLGSFSLLFRRYSGYTPTHFRQRANARQLQIKEKPLVFIPGCFASARGWDKKQF